MDNVLPYIAIAFSGVTLLVMVGEKLFGGGNALAAKFHTLDKEITAAVAVVEGRLDLKVSEYEKTSGTGFESVRANIHAMQLGLLEFRAKTAEELHLYIRKDDYNVGVNDIKRDMQAGFRTVDDRIGQLQDLILYVSPDMPKPRRTPV